MKLRGLILKVTFPIVYMIGKMHWPFNLKRRCDAKVFEGVRKAAKPGTVILSRKRLEPSNLFFGGDQFWTHAGIMYDDETVIESIGRGVVKTHLYDFLREKDFISIYTPKFLTEGQMKLAALRAETHEGMPYDYGFEWSASNNDAFYCSELVWDAYQGIVKDLPFEPRYTFGVLTIVPQDFDNAKKKFTLDYTNLEK